MIRRVLRDFVAFFPSKIIPAIAGLASTLVLPRLLPKDALGSYLITLTTLTLVAGFCSSWLVTIVLRFTSRLEEHELRRTLRRYVLFSLGLAVVLWTGIQGAALSPDRGAMAFAVGAAWLIAQVTFDYQAGWLRSTRRPARYAIAVTMRNLGGILLAVVLLLVWSPAAQLVVLGFAIATALGVAVIMTGNSRRMETGHEKQSAVERSELLRYGVPAAISSVVITSLSLADRYIVDAILGTEVVAVYGSNYDLAEKTVFFANSMLLLSSSVVGFQIFESDGEQQAARFLGRLMWLYLVVVVPVVALIIDQAPTIVSLLLGPGFREGATAFAIVTASGVLVGIMHRYSLLLSFHKRTGAILACSAIALVANIIACLVLIPRFHLAGAATATFLGYLTWLVAIRLAVRRHILPRFPMLALLRVAGCTIVAVAAARVAALTSPGGWVSLAAAGTTGSITYGLLILAVGEVQWGRLTAALRARPNNL